MSRRKLSSLRFKKNPTKTHGYAAVRFSFDVSTIVKRSIRGRENLKR